MSRKELVVLWILILVLSSLSGWTVGSTRAAELTEESTNGLYFPLVGHGQIKDRTLSVYGQLVSCDTGAPVSNFPLRLAEVWEDKVVVLDLAYDPGTFSNEDGYFRFAPFKPLTNKYMVMFGQIDLLIQNYELGPFLYVPDHNDVIDAEVDLIKICTNL